MFLCLRLQLSSSENIISIQYSMSYNYEMNLRCIVFFSIFVSCSLSGFSQTHSQDLDGPSSSTQVNPQREIFENDKILINIRKVPELSGGFNVDQAGMVDLQLIGKVKAAGLRPYEFEKVLTELYGRDYLQSPFIRIELVDSFKAEDITLSETAMMEDVISPDDGFSSQELDEGKSTEIIINPGSANLDFVPIEDFIRNEPNVIIETPREPLVDVIEVPLSEQAMPIPLTSAPSEGVIKDNVLADTNWTFESDPRAFIQFLSDGKIAGFTGCNNFFANYTTLVDDFVKIQFVASTFDACADVKDGEFQEQLEAITRYEYSEPDKLVLMDEENEAVFTLRQGFSLVQDN